MAKIDTTKIEGYEEMTPEQKIEALTAFELTAEPDKALIEREARLKKALDRSMSDTAEYKRQVRAMQTEAERAAAEKAEADAAKEAELQALRREKSISQYQAQLLQIAVPQNHLVPLPDAQILGNTGRKKHLILPRQRKLFFFLVKINEISQLLTA